MFDWTVPAENTILTKLMDFIKILCPSNIADYAKTLFQQNFSTVNIPAKGEVEKIGKIPKNGQNCNFPGPENG